MIFGYEILKGGRWFKMHPEKVLGIEETRSGKYGTESYIKGTMADIEQGIEVNEVKPFPFVISKDNPLLETQETQHDRMAEAIANTEYELEHPPSSDGFEMQSFETILGQNSEISDAEVRAWVDYQMGRMFAEQVVSHPNNGWSKFVTPKEKRAEQRKQWVRDGVMVYDGNTYIPASLFYAGNIYYKIGTLTIQKENIVDKFGIEVFDAQMTRLEAAKPEPLRLNAPKNERLYLSPLAPFCNEITVTELVDGQVFESPTSLVNAFRWWLTDLPSEMFKHGSSAWNVANIYLDGDAVRGSGSKLKKAAMKRKAYLDGNDLFQEFIHEALKREDQLRIELEWNRTYNFWTEIDQSKIPLGFEVNKHFKDGLLKIRDAQYEGVKFLTANGNGCIAYDVGVGKTMTAIMALANALYTGQCKRPLVVVPSPTYAKWIKEIVGEYDKNGKVVKHGILPNYKDRICDYNNLGVDYKDRITTNPVEDFKITFVTYEGFAKLGASPRLEDEIKDELIQIMNQGQLDERDGQKLVEKIESMLGSASSDVEIFIDEAGFDYLVIDEAHNFKNLFTSVKGRKGDDDEKRGRNPYQLQGGAVSNRAIKAFIVSQYVQKRNGNRNVCLLTATPFTNSPLEVYSMMALVGYGSLVKAGLQNIIDFFDQFIKMESEEVVTMKGIEMKEVVRGFSNRVALQSLIFSNFLYKTGEEASVPRPVKVVYPLIKDENGNPYDEETSVSTFLPATSEQRRWLEDISKFVRKEPSEIEELLPRQYFDERGNIPGRDLLAITLARSITLSPYLLQIKDEDSDEVIKLADITDPTPEEFVEDSPKIKYVINCVQSVKDWHEKRGEPVSGQVIYANRGIEYFPLIKEYLIKYVGYKPNEVEIIASGITAKKKERIKDDFLEGKVKIIIGSPTIQEGIDLQTKSTVLYNLTLDWTPTALKQLEGRIWRQGNQHTHVRIVHPLLEDSIDPFMFQKLDEKTSRINDIWYRADRCNVLKLEEMDPKELKKGLMTNPVDRAKSDVYNDIESAERQAEIAAEQLVDVLDAVKLLEEYGEEVRNLRDEADNARQQLGFKLEAEKRTMEDTYTDARRRQMAKNRVERITEMLERDMSDTRSQFAVIKYYVKLFVEGLGWYSSEKSRLDALDHRIDEQIKRTKRIGSIEKNVIKPAGYEMTDDLSPLITYLENVSAEATKRVDHLRSEEYLQSVIDQYTKESEASLANRKPVEGRVLEFEKHNHLLSCLVDVHECSIDAAGIPMLKKVKPEPAAQAMSEEDEMELAIAIMEMQEMEFLFSNAA